MTDNKGTATRLLQHYLRLSAQGAGVQWDSDNNAEVAAIVDAMIAASVQQVAEDGARAAQARRELEALDLEDFAQQPAEEDATQPAHAHEYIQRVNEWLSVHIENVDSHTAGVTVYDPDAKHAYVQVTVCADSDVISVYASSAREVVVKRYEDYFRHPDEQRTAVLSVTQRTATATLEAQCDMCRRKVELSHAVKYAGKRYLCPACASKALRGYTAALEALTGTQPAQDATSADAEAQGL